MYDKIFYTAKTKKDFILNWQSLQYSYQNTHFAIMIIFRLSLSIPGMRFGDFNYFTYHKTRVDVSESDFQYC